MHVTPTAAVDSHSRIGSIVAVPSFAKPFALGLKWWQSCLLVLGFSALVAGIWVSNDAMTYARLDRAIPWGLLAVSHLVAWGSWALMTPALYVFVRWWSLTATPRWKTLAVYTAAGTVSILLNVAVTMGGRVGLVHIWRADVFWKTWSPGQPLSAAYAAELQRLLAFDALLFLLVIFALHALIYFSTAREREIEAARLSTQLASARLDVLTFQVRPHFLFNTLNTISGLVTLDPRRADRMISRLADLMRISLSGGCGSLVTLREELELLDAYLEIQQTRFDDRLLVERDIDSRFHDALVPAFLFQPVVENTIRHAVAPYSAPVRLTIGVSCVAEKVCLTVRDDGPGLPVEDATLLHEGVGLRNTRIRLEHLYGSRQRFEIRTGREGGVDVVIELPLQTEARATGPGLERTPA